MSNVVLDFCLIRGIEFPWLFTLLPAKVGSRHEGVVALETHSKTRFSFCFWCFWFARKSREFGQDKSGLTAEENQSSTRLQNSSWKVASKSSSFEIRVLLKKVLCLFESKRLCSSIFIDVQCFDKIINAAMLSEEDIYKSWTSWVSSIRDRRRERSGSPLSPELSPLPWRPHVCGRSFSIIIWFDNDLISFLSSFVFYFLCSFLESFTALVILLRSRESKPGFSICKRSTEHWEVSWVSWIVNWLSWVAATSSWTSLWTATTGPASLGKRPFLQRTADCQETCWCGCIGIENRCQLNLLDFFCKLS